MFDARWVDVLFGILVGVGIAALVSMVGTRATADEVECHYPTQVIRDDGFAGHPAWQRSTSVWPPAPHRVRCEDPDDCHHVVKFNTFDGGRL